MISTSSGFQTLLANSSRHFMAQIRKSGSVVNCDIKSIKIHKGACGDSTLTIGSVYSSYAELTVEGLTTLLENEDIEIRLGMTVSGSPEYITMGKFTVSKIKSTTYESNITAVGFISSKLAVDLPALQSQTIPNIIAGITSATGISISLSGLTSAGTITAPMTTMSCRDALGLVTFLLGGYATETASGGIQISKYQIPTNKLAVNGNRMLSEPTFADSAFTMTGIKVVVSEESVDDEGEPIPEVSYETATTVRQIYENKYMTQALFNTFKNNVVGYTYMSGDVDLSLGDPRLEPWDCLAVTDLSSNTYNVPCHQIIHTFDGGLSTEVIAEGSSESDSGYEGSITKQLAQVNTELIQAQDGATKAGQAAANAQTSANAAATAASAAQTSANAAQASADAAATAASNAQADATAAKTAAASAQSSADSALVSLSTVEDVVGVLNWITAHGTMTSNGSAALDPAKVYFKRDNNGDYQVGSYRYSIVSEPKSSERTSYYTLSVDESVQNYVATHVAVNTEGLWLIPDQNGTPTTNGKKILIATGAGSSYPVAGTYIIDRSGGVDKVVASFGSGGVNLYSEGKLRSSLGTSAQTFYDTDGQTSIAEFGSNEARIGAESGRHIAIDNDSFDIRNGQTVLASFSETVIIGDTQKAYIELTSDTIAGHADTDYFSISSSGGKKQQWAVMSNTAKKAYVGRSSITINLATGTYGYNDYVDVWATLPTGTRFKIVVYTTYSNITFIDEEECVKGTESPNYRNFGNAECGYNGIDSIAFYPTLYPQDHASNGTWKLRQFLLYVYKETNSAFYRFGQDVATEGGHYSFLMGEGTKASYGNQLAIGKYNADVSDGVFIIGNGADNDNRSNAFTVDWNGNVNVAGDISVRDHVSPIGDRVQVIGGSDSDITATANTWYTLAELELTAGRWVVTARARFTPSASGNHYSSICVTTTPNLEANRDRRFASGTVACQHSTCIILGLEEESTVYLRGAGSVAGTWVRDSASSLQLDAIRII